MSARPALIPTLALSLAAALWGSTFVVAKDLVSRYDPSSVLALRFAMAVLVLWLARPTCLRGVSSRTWRRGLLLGGFYGMAQLAHFYALTHTTASTAGFVAATYILFTPIFGYLIYRVRAGRNTLAGTGLAIVGLAVVTLHDWQLGVGEGLMLISAILYAAQIVALSAWSLPGEAWALTIIQMVGITATTALPVLFIGFDPPATSADWMTLLYLAIGAGALGIGIQTWAQGRLAAAHAAVIMAAEPIWAAGLAVLLTNEAVTARLMVGGALIVAANLVMTRPIDQAVPRRRRGRRLRRAGTTSSGTRR